MAFGNSFASFVNGFVDGREVKHKWEDRKDAKERQAVLDGYEAQRQERLGEIHGWNGEKQGWARDQHGAYMDNAEYQDRVREQAWTDDQLIRDATRQADEAARAGGAAVGPVEGAAASVTPQPQAQPTARGADAADPMLGGLGAAPEVSARNGGGPLAAPVVDDAFLQPQADGKVAATRAPRTAEEKAALVEAAKSGRLTQIDPDRQAQIDAAGNARQQAGPVARALELDRDREWGMPGQAGADIAEAGKVVARGAVEVADMAHNQGARGIRQVARPLNSIARWITGEDFGEPSNADTLNRNAPDFPDAPDAEKAAEGAANVLDADASTPAGKAVADGVAADLPELGVKSGKNLSAAQVDKAADSYMVNYREKGLPIITQELMRQGKYEQAEALGKFVNEAAAQEGMKSWSGAVFSAMSGDVENAADKMIEAYNTSGYFDDGFEVVRADTSLTRDDEGNVTGMKLAMKNQQTGEVSIQEGEIDDLINRGLWLLSPQKAAERYLARQQSYQEKLAELAAEKRETGGKIILEDQKANNAAALEIYKSHVGLDGKPTITFEEARRMVTKGSATDEDYTNPFLLRRPK